MCNDKLSDGRHKLLELADASTNHPDFFAIVRFVSGGILLAFVSIFLAQSMIGLIILLSIVGVTILFLFWKIDSQKRRIDALVKLLELDKSGKENEEQTK